MMKLSNADFTAFVGLDWADAKHDICVQALLMGCGNTDVFFGSYAALQQSLFFQENSSHSATTARGSFRPDIAIPS